ncbi:glutamate 5-kinase [Streptococcus pneumoniae]|nr:glutamate 5-kinase [Streptococcus pneumoniae]CJO73961.1 glutamate 5-kinase [Streptococcus pneumoniae]VFH59738.1 glutamate 5-kinase [Streptococcus pneumoniae]
MAGGAGSSNGTGGMLTKIKAATIATESGVPVYICSSLKSDSMIEAAEETEDGSYFVAQEKGLRTQKQWLAFYAQSQGSIWVDKGAAEALSQHGKSLLLSGIVEAEGAFSYGDIVTVFDKESGKSLGKGRVQFGASALEDMLRSQKAKGVLIYRDDWISITPEIQLLFTEF